MLFTYNIQTGTETTPPSKNEVLQKGKIGKCQIPKFLNLNDPWSPVKWTDLLLYIFIMYPDVNIYIDQWFDSNIHLLQL